MTIPEALQAALEHHQKGELPQAESLYRQVLQADPNNADALHLLGVIAHQCGKNEEAVEIIEKAVSLRPWSAEAHNNLGNALSSQGKLDEAIERYREALRLKPEYPEAHNNLGNALSGQGKLDEAIAGFRASLDLRPDSPETNNNLGVVLSAQGKLGEAIACYREALRLKPEYAEAHNNLGNALSGQGKLDEAIDRYREALSLKPDYHLAHSNLLLALQYMPGVNAAALKLAHEEFEVSHGWRTLYNRKPYLTDTDPDRTLRAGIVSSDLRQHPVAFFLVRLLENLDPSEIQIICYSNSSKEDELTGRLRKMAVLWRKVAGLPDAALAQQIYDDRIDVLFDLGGHTANNRLAVFARKPAPVQISWIGYAGTSGLRAMNYLMSDPVCIPEGEEESYTEKIIRLPDIFLCYDPPGYAPGPGPLPALANGFITFGSFNNPVKINSEVISAWCEILNEVARSRLILKARSFSDDSTRKRYYELFDRHGIDPLRIDLLPQSPHAEYLATYNSIDISLDTFPFSGGTTSCESLWMGVPVVTLYGQTALGRQGASLNAQLGLQHFIAGTKKEYVEIAMKAAEDLEMLSGIRRNLRGIMDKSPICDGKRFAGNWTKAVREVWQAWCSNVSKPGC